jgi:hypothetical protein
MLKALIVLAVLVGGAAMAQTSREAGEVCSIIAQQRNNLADQIAAVEARRRIAQERVGEWEAYFKAYVGAPAS